MQSNLATVHERVSASFPTTMGDRFVNVIADVAEADDVCCYVSTALDRFGRIEILFSNAGNDGPILNIADYPENVFEFNQRVHVWAAYLPANTRSRICHAAD